MLVCNIIKGIKMFFEELCFLLASPNRSFLGRSELKFISQGWSTIKNIPHEEIVGLMDALTNSDVKTLILDGYYIYENSLEYIVNTLKMTNLTTLAIKGCAIYDELAIKLVEIIKTTNITTLDLSNNEIGIKGAGAIIDVLKKSKVKKLCLNQNNFEETQDALNSKPGPLHNYLEYLKEGDYRTASTDDLIGENSSFHDE